ncbi:MAG TPA: ParB/RepB/Spo0J family partition protein [Myxococcota bacterium]|nr:ParB/RepB/Spo0J family partition protein [Myxococcota bacterium]
MTKGRSALGRGLGALIPGAGPGASSQGEALPAAGGPAEIEVERIDPNPEQPRRIFDAEQLERLADSIRRHGVLQPVVVRAAGERYELVVGERRWRAAQVAGRKTIPVVIAEVAPKDRLELALVENVQRHDLNPIELALAFRALTEGGATQEEIGERVALDRSTVANHLRLLELGRDLQADVEHGRLSVGHAKALLQIQSPEHRRQLRDRIVAQQLSVRAAEEAARGVARMGERKAKAAPSPSDPNLGHLVDALRERLKTRVRVVGAASGRGQIEIEFYGAGELDRIARIILEGM